MNNDDYGKREIPLIPGELYGMRAFRIRPDGTLSPLHRNKSYVYKAGVNEAKCDDEPYEMTMMLNTGAIISKITVTPELVFHTNGDFTAPNIDCTCGFYAYFEDANETSFMQHDGDNQVNAIVRATGRCIVGDFGFKAQKLEIVGFIADPPESRESKRTRIGRFMVETSKAINVDWWKRYIYFLVLHFTLVILHTIYEENVWLTFAFQCTTLILWSVCIVAVTTGLYTLVHLKKKIKDMASQLGRPSPQVTAKLVAAYPNVPLFTTLQEAKNHFPVSKASDLPQ